MPVLVDILDTCRQDPRLDQLLADAPVLGHDHNWEGELAGTSGSASQCVIKIKAQLGFHGDLIEGVGRAVNFPSDMPASDAEFAVSGTIDMDAIGFQLWFACDQVRREPFVASGSLSCGGREMAGTWSVKCFNPGTCDCQGGSGTFLLKRID